ncbi:MAG: DUF192 domain-containing protein [Planctomycetota bacterium]
MRWHLTILLAFVACNGEPVEETGLPETDGEIVSIPADDDGSALLAVIDEGLSTPGRGPDLCWFVLIRALDRHDPRIPDTGYHFVVGAGVNLPAGSIRARRVWSTAGVVDGANSELDKFSVAVAIERRAPRPYPEAVTQAVGRICEALVSRGVKLHPDCVLAMGEVPFSRHHDADADERILAAAARTRVPVPTPDGNMTVHGAEARTVAYELRDTDVGRNVGMMMRKRFDGENRGMLFVYPHRASRRFWMRNCFVPMDLAYIKNGKIVQIERMSPQPGVPEDRLPRYESITAIRYVLEVPSGWFARNGVAVGARVEGLPQ